jgi:hypothetical protein
MEAILRKENESFLDWKYRLIEAKFKKEIDVSWQQLVDILGLECHPGSLRKASYGIIEAKHHYDKKVRDNLAETVIAEIEDKQRELRKERTKLQDRKRDFMKYEKIEARFEALLDEMSAKMDDGLPTLDKIEQKPFDVLEKREGLALFSDWHYGAKIDSSFNVYNRDIAKQRIKELAQKIIQYGKHNGISTLHVAQLGDIINGQIHVTSRLHADIDSVQQTMEVTELLAEVLAEFCNAFPNVVFYNVIGNHGRTAAKKEEATIRDNFEYFVCWYLQLRLKDFDNLKIIEDKEGLIATEIMNQKVVLAHGNYEKMNTAEGLTQLFGYVLNQVFFGHYHHNHQKEIGQHTEIIVNNSLCGADEYALTLRKVSKAAQKFVIYNEDGLENIYNIKFK